jgi:3-phosphoshikimate 1-carboxyvinyltransferase
MGAVLHGRRADSLPPLTVVGHTPLQAVDHTTSVPSAQVKSAILLAGLRAEGRTTVRERVATRDHTERMLRARGVAVTSAATDAGVASTVEGGIAVETLDQTVPAEISAAAFWLVGGAIHPDAELTLIGVGVNPTRRAVIDLLRAMGADIDETRPEDATPDDGVGEPVADLIVRSSAMHGIDIGPADVAAAIDEIPVLCLAATTAHGTTVIRGAGELRHKESDRIAGTAAGLRALGARVEVEGDDLRITGPTRLAGAETDSLDDHRLAMTFAIAGLIASGETSVGRPGSAAISYPGFFDDLERVRA